MRLATPAAHLPTSWSAVSPPISQAAAYGFDEIEQFERVASDQAPRYLYGRYGTENTTPFGAPVASLEGAAAAVAWGMDCGDIAVHLALLEPQRVVVGPRDSFGGTYDLLEQDQVRLGSGSGCSTFPITARSLLGLTRARRW